MPKAVIAFMFKVLQNGLLRYILYTGCDNVRVQSATEWTASVHTSHMSKPVITFVLKVIRNGLLRYILCLHMLKPVITFVFKVIPNGLLPYIRDTLPNAVITFVFKVLENGLLRCIFTHAQSRDNVRVECATEWTVSVHT